MPHSCTTNLRLSPWDMFTPNANHSIFLKYDESGKLICNHHPLCWRYHFSIQKFSNKINKAKEALCNTFDMTDLENQLDLGLQVIRDHEKRPIMLLQEKYIYDILKTHGKLTRDLFATPSLLNKQLSSSTSLIWHWCLPIPERSQHAHVHNASIVPTLPTLSAHSASILQPR